MIRIAGSLVGAALGRSAYGVECRLRGLIYSFLWRKRGLRIGRDVLFVGRSRISLETNVTLFGTTVINAYGNKGRVDIGAETHIDHHCVIYGQGGVRIGRGCAIAAGVIIYSQSNQVDMLPSARVIDQPIRYAEVSIGDDVWIGARSVILPGVSVGDHAVIGAGSVVTRDVEAWDVVAGVPAKVLRRRNPDS
jgi:acetyltransferase-like isoleucine patch superfamily enzyme